MINANEITFGIELETTIPAGTLAVGPHGAGLAIPQLSGWLADRDPSIRARAGRQACEFVSPVFKGTDGLRQLLADLRTIKALGAEVNASCGLHVHVGVDRANAGLMQKLATLVSNFEKALYAVTGTKNRERGRWCGGLRRHGSADNAIRHAQYDRYHVANFGSGKPTVEFRAFSGSLNPDKIVGYVLMCIALVEKAYASKRVTAWTPKPNAATSPVTRKGVGQTQLVRFFYATGWLKGDRDYTFGNLFAEGIPSLPRVKRTLMKLARKYDEQP